MQWLKRVAIGLVSLIVLLALIGLLLPSKTQVERSIVIERPLSLVHPLLNSFKRFNEWSPWFAADPNALAQGLLYATIIAWSQPFVAAESVYEGVLGGAGDTRSVAVIAIPGNILRIPLAWVLAFPLGFGAAGIWWAVGISSMVKAILKGVMVARGRWLTHPV